MFVSIIIPAYNAEKTIERCLESIFDMEYPNDEIEVIVVDDGSTDHTQDIVKNFGSVKCIRRKRKGTASAQNVGIEASEGGMIMIVDSDAYITKDWLKKALEEFVDPHVGIVVGCIEPAPTMSFWARLAGYDAEDRIYEIKSEYIDCSTTLCALYRRKVFAEVGLFDDYLSVSGYDIDFSRRAFKAGWKIVLRKDTACFHVWRSSFVSYFKQQVREGQSGIKLLRKDPALVHGSKIHPKRLFVPVFLTALLLLSIPVCFFLGKWSVTLPIILYIGIVVWHLSQTFRIMRRHREPLLILFPLVMIVRYIAWLTGFFVAIVKVLKE